MKYLGGIEAAQDIVSKDYVDTGLDVKSNVAELAGIEESMIATSTYAVDDFLQYMDPNGYNHFAIVIAPIDIGDRLEVHENIEDTTISEQLRYLDGKMVTLTKAEYDALSYAEKMDPDKFYFITDVTVSSDDFIDDSVVALDSTWSSTKINLNVEQLQASLLTKQPMLTFDNTPTDSSNNPVKSQGIKTAITMAKDESISASEQELRDTVGWTGKNLFDYNSCTRQVIDSSGNISGDPTCCLSDYIELDTDAITFSADSVVGTCFWRFAFYTSAKVFIERPSGEDNPYTCTVPSNAKYVRVCLTDDTTLSNYFVNPMLRNAHITDSTYESYHSSVDIVKANRDEVKDVIGWSGKNLLQIPSNVTNTTKNGIEFTVNRNANGEVNYINANNSSQSNYDTYFTLQARGGDYSLPAGSYIISGGINNEIFIYITDVNNNVIGSTKYGENEFTLASNTNGIGIGIYIPTGSQVTNIEFYPMIRFASISDSTYEPYHESVDRAKFNRSEQNLLGAKNLVPTDVATIKSNNDGSGWVWNGNVATYNGISFTINTDGTILVQGSIDDPDGGNAVLNLYLPTSLGGNFYYYGCPANGSLTSYDCFAYDNTEQERAKKWDGETSIDLDFGEYESQQVQFIAGHINRLAIRVHVECADTLNILFKPMLRLASDSDATYQPYAMTNRQLTEAVLHTSVTVNPETPPTEDGAIWIST